MIQRTTDHDLLLIEFERIEHAMAAATKLLVDLQVLRDDLEKELEAITRPDTSAIVKQPALNNRGYEYRGQSFTTKYKIEIYLGIVRRIWQEFPDRRENAAVQLKSANSSRSSIAPAREALFSNWPGWKARKYSAPLPDAWFADINLSQQQMSRNLQIVVGSVGLRWRVDVRVCWG